MNEIHCKNGNLETKENTWSPHDQGQPVLGHSLLVTGEEADEGRGANCQWEVFLNTVEGESILATTLGQAELEELDKTNAEDNL